MPEEHWYEWDRYYRKGDYIRDVTRDLKRTFKGFEFYQVRAHGSRDPKKNIVAAWDVIGQLPEPGTSQRIFVIGEFSRIFEEAGWKETGTGGVFFPTSVEFEKELQNTNAIARAGIFHPTADHERRTMEGRIYARHPIDLFMRKYGADRKPLDRIAEELESIARNIRGR